MSISDALNEALRSAKVTRAVVLEDDAFDRLPAVVDAHLGPGPFAILCDDNTWAAVGREVSQRIAASGRDALPVIMPGQPRLKPNLEHSRAIADMLRDDGRRAIAVGSGVVNDLAKHASALAERPYICVPTAASMDGYSASGAPLIEDGFKRTFPCPPPIAVVAAPHIVASAPPAMATWGYGDLAGKYAAGGDWILADALDEDPISAPEWHLVQDNLGAWLSDPTGVRDGDPQAVGRLLEGLLMSGFAMQSHGSSRPASGSDHQFSHLWEMEGLSVDGVPVAHGVCVGIGCLASLTLYDWLIERDLSRIDIDALLARRRPVEEVEAEVRAAFRDPRIAEASVIEVRAKTPDGARLRGRLTRLSATWRDLRGRLSTHLPRAEAVRINLAVQGLPVDPAVVGITAETFARDHARAAMVRRRYTVFDLLTDIGLFDAAVGATTGPGGFWG